MTGRGFRSRRGLWTLIRKDEHSLSALEINEKQARLVRAMGGFILDREDFAKEYERATDPSDERWAGHSLFKPFGKHRLFCLERVASRFQSAHYEDSE